MQNINDMLQWRIDKEWRRNADCITDRKSFKQTNKQRTVLFVVIYHMLGPYSEFLPHFPDF